MATAQLNPVITSLSGGVGNLVFYKRYGRTVMRTWIMPPNPRTVKQQSNRARFAQAMAAWQGLRADDKALYNARAKKLRITGHNLFISRYMKGHTDGNSCVPPAGDSGRLKRMKGRIKEIGALETGHQSFTPFSPGRYDEGSLTRSYHDPYRLFFALFCGEKKKGTSRPCSGSSPALPGLPGISSSSLHPTFRSVTAPSAIYMRAITLSCLSRRCAGEAKIPYY